MRETCPDCGAPLSLDEMRENLEFCTTCAKARDETTDLLIEAGEEFLGGMESPLTLEDFSE